MGCSTEFLCLNKVIFHPKSSNYGKVKWPFNYICVAGIYLIFHKLIIMSFGAVTLVFIVIP